MRTVFVILLTALLLMAVAVLRAGKGTNETEKFEGTWAVVQAGDQKILRERSPFRWVFKGDRVTILEDRRIQGTFKVDPTKTPNTIDVRFPEDDHARLGIYVLNNGSLKLFMDEDGAKRPADFRETDGLLVFARIGPPLATAAERKQALEKLEKVGGKLLREKDDEGEPVFSLSNAKIASADLVHLHALWPDLKVLYLNRTTLDDDGLKHIAVHNDLTVLDLSDTKITDDGLVHLLKLTKLKELRLAETQISDTGLNHLKSLQSLEMLNLLRTRVTKQGLDDLRKALPKAKITVSP